MNKEELSYKDALFKADQIITEPERLSLEANPLHDQLKAATPLKQSQLESRAKQYFNDGLPVTNSLAEVYLNGISDKGVKENDNIRFHNHVYSSETRTNHPALIAGLTNSDGEIKGIEVTYLNSETGDISDLKINKRVLGTKSGNSIPINDGIQADYSIVAVGIENAIHINNHNHENADIVSVPNNRDCRTFDTDNLRDNIIIVLNQENTAVNDKLIEEITDRLERDGKHATIIEPVDISQNPSMLIDNIKSVIEDITTQDKAIPDSILQLNQEINIPTLPDDNTNLTNTEKVAINSISIDNQLERENSKNFIDKEQSNSHSSPQPELDRELTR